MDGLALIIGIVGAIICGFAGSHIMKSKGRSAGAGAALGVLLGVIGLVITLAISPKDGPRGDGEGRNVYQPPKLPDHVRNGWS